MDLTPTLAPKSNQLNADDLIAGPRTIQITKVSAGNAEQPVAVYFDGDNGKPWYPCKSMRRVMVAAWGTDGASYVGRLLTIYRDPEVMYGGIKVGGIRISAMSHIDTALSLALTVTRQKRAPYVVKPLAMPAPAPAAPAREEMQAQALGKLREQGLTDAGLAALLLQLGGPDASSLADLPDKTISRLASAGAGAETIGRWNAATAEPTTTEPTP